MECTVPPTLIEEVGYPTFQEYTATLIVPCGSADAYRADTVWGQFTNIIEDCTGIDDLEVMGYSLWVMNGRIIVECAEGETVRVYDMVGRLTQTFKHSSNQAIPNGVYLVKVGDRPAKKVIVMNNK